MEAHCAGRVVGGAAILARIGHVVRFRPHIAIGEMQRLDVFLQRGLRKNFLKLLLGSQLVLPDSIWHRLNVAWVVYTAFMAAINAYVVLYYSTEAWVTFKLWGYAFPLVFIIGQGLYIAPHIKGDEPSSDQAKP